jgi:hypothetical protein
MKLIIAILAFVILIPILSMIWLSVRVDRKDKGYVVWGIVIWISLLVNLARELLDMWEDIL